MTSLKEHKLCPLIRLAFKYQDPFKTENRKPFIAEEEIFYLIKRIKKGDKRSKGKQ
jgi:hypothetical protein